MSSHCNVKPAFHCLVTLCLSLPVTVHGHSGDRVYPIHELSPTDLTAIDLHDGSIDDWRAIVGEPTLTALDFYLRDYDPASFDFQMWLAWSREANHFYVALVLFDDDYVNEFERSTESSIGLMEWWDSAVRLVVDGDHSGGPFFPNDDAENQGQAQWYSAIGETFDDGPQVQVSWVELVEADGYLSDWMLKPPFADGGGTSFGEAPTVAVTEFFVTPFDRFVWNSASDSEATDLAPGNVLGFAISLWDIDRTGKSDSAAALPEDFGPNADSFADGLLLGAEGTAVESLSWGKIKAALHVDDR